MSVKVVSIILLSLAYANCYLGAKVYRISFSDPSQLKVLTDVVDLDVWRQNKSSADFLVAGQHVPIVNSILKERNIPYTVTINDVQSLINAEISKTNSNGGVFSLDSYNTLDTIYRWMEYKAESNAANVQVETIGYSVEQRPIKVLRVLSGHPNSPAIVIEAGMHGREWASIAAVLRIMDDVLENRSDLPTSFLDIYFIPVSNPDGYVYTHTRNRFWRKNRSEKGKCYGVDLARNFDIDFGGTGTSGDSCEDTYRGPRAFSEPETAYFANFIQKIKSNLKAYISLHSYGELIMVPYSYSNVHADNSNDLFTVAKQAAYNMKSTGGNYKVGTLPELIRPVSGTPFDWVKAKIGTQYSYGFELREFDNTGILMPSSYIETIAGEASEGIKAIIQAIEN